MPEQKHIRFCLDKSYAFFHLLYGDIFHIRFLPVSTYIIYTFFDLSSSPAFPKDKGTQYLIQNYHHEYFIGELSIVSPIFVPVPAFRLELSIVSPNFFLPLSNSPLPVHSHGQLPMLFSIPELPFEFPCYLRRTLPC